ncbi:hypothetical protein HJC23_008508 [Cyclotella cryptica]|uniref:Radical SAM core domain-containing protein n=1 Tax=Cyclotella cryptica TaxID=29204 RepID=A0ABD3QW78_9STRA|eukprot:CCRYP_001261-RC/>CCRYP_001261-RC protein AED:0.06 eAED:0.06 QI:4215/1/1/1/0.8/0.5/6/551/536
MTTAPAIQIKRHRDPLSPRPVLDRSTLTKSLNLQVGTLKNSERQIDLFYQLLHRSGYIPLDSFVASLRDGGKADECDDADARVVNFRTKNAISSRAGRLPQLSRSFIRFLAENCASNGGFVTLTSKVKMHQTSADGSTTKIAVELQDGHVVESVLMRHEGRATLCVSSQVGCAMGCTFCATGTMGIRGNLCSGEILEQLVHASRILATETSSQKDESIKKEKHKRLDLIRNVVFMGMGEPLNNYSNVLATCRALIDRRLWNLAHNRVTVSTVGVTSRMRDLTRDLPEVNLALSLHAPNQKMREAIVPAAKGTPIESLIDALDEHMMALTKKKLSENPQESDSDDRVTSDSKQFDKDERQTASKKKRAMIEYVMLVGDTSSIEAAHQLGKLCEGRHLVVNLIPYNKTDVRDKLSCPSEEHMQEFRRIVSSYGSFCSIRRTMGADIAGACGQLVVEQEKHLNTLNDIEDGPFCENTSIKRGKKVNKAKDRDKTPSLDHEVTTANKDVNMIRLLTIATAISTSCFILSAALLILQRKKR